MTLSVRFTCGGTIINHKTILFASHCVAKSFTYNSNSYDIGLNSYYPTWASMYDVYVGLQNSAFLSTGASYYPAVKFAASDVYTHPGFSSSSLLNDVAILKLKDLITLSGQAQPACLTYETSSIFPGTNLNAWIVGWGKESYTATSGSTILKNAQITVYDSTKCNNVYPSTTKNWDAQICAGNYTGGVDTCQGDSGGGLFTKYTVNNSSRYFASGIVSYGDQCALAGKPGIYTRSSYYIDWIVYNYDF